MLKHLTLFFKGFFMSMTDYATELMKNYLNKQKHSKKKKKSSNKPKKPY